MCGAEACSVEIRGQLRAVGDGGKHLHLLSYLSGPVLRTSNHHVTNRRQILQEWPGCLGFLEFNRSSCSVETAPKDPKDSNNKILVPKQSECTWKFVCVPRPVSNSATAVFK